MNKAEMIEAMAGDAGISKAEAKRALDSFVNHTTKCLKKG
ncbi:MAG: HU family DNA-binding protein, partial [Flavobacteriales bacterium]|nr:HU family DNA-binding protein [Flavobacteriales bacterium]